MHDWPVLVGLLLACLGGIVLAAIRLPGTWLILLAATGYAWYGRWQRVGWRSLALLAGLALLGEGVELVGSVALARRAGASRRAAWFGLIGGVAGMIVFSIPVPVIGTILGGAAGCAIGAILAELSVRDEFQHGVRVGLFSAAGYALGAVAKLLVAFVMAAVALAAALFW